MRKLILTMLLATVATPVLADPGDGDRHGHHDRGGQQQGGQRAERPQPQQRQPAVVMAPQRDPRSAGVPNAAAGMRGGQGVDPAMVARWRQRQAQGGVSPAIAGQVQAGDSHYGDRGRGNGFSGGRQGWQQPNAAGGVQAFSGERGADRGQYNGGQYNRGQYNGNRAYDANRDAYRDRGGHDGRWANDQGRNGQRWSNDWRRDQRYDWQQYRERNRFVFRVGSYYDPFGYGYRPLSIGFALYSGYYQPNYWLNDPYQYRLPPVYGPYRWVRYYNDAVLVDIYNGEVEDVIHNFFW